MYRVSHFMTTFALCLLAGALVGLVWANIAPFSYLDLIEWRLIDGFPVGYPNPDATGLGHRTLTLHYLVNTVLMALFFLLAGKELWEDLAQRGGALRGEHAIVPLAAALGSMVLPMLIYLAIAATTRNAEWVDLRGGWAIPAATDLVLAYVVGRAVFGPTHPALRFLMLLAIVGDLGTLLILGLVNPLGDLKPLWLILPVAAVGLAYGLCVWSPRRFDNANPARPFSRLVRRAGVAPWLVAGLASWFGFQEAGLHPALGLLPVIPAIPHSDRAFGFFAEVEEYLNDMLNRIAHLLTIPVAGTLFLFGLLNGGAVTDAFLPATTVVFFALTLGKPLGVLAGGLLAARLSGLGLPKGISRADLAVVGIITGTGFCVPLLMTSAALPGGAVQEAARLGIVFSLFTAPAGLLAARALRLGRWARQPR